MTKLIVELPTKQTPGFLRRSKSAIGFQNKMKANVINENVIDEMVDFLLPLVKEPVDRDEARAALWDASQEQFEEMMAALIGGNVNPTKAESLPSSTPQA